MNTFKSLKISHSTNNSYVHNFYNSNNNLSITKILEKYRIDNCNKSLKKMFITKNLKRKNYKMQFEIEKKIYKNFKDTYSLKPDFYNIKVINEIICNENTHIVAEFKDYLIKGDYSEFIQKYYLLVDSIDCLPRIFEYYESCSVIFPNYVILPESRYLYKNIQRKQRIIDYQQELEDEKERKKNENLNNNIEDKNEIIFNENIIDSILNQTDTSGIKKFFGLNIDNNDSSNTFTVNNVVLMIDKAEREKKINIEKKNNSKNKKKNSFNMIPNNSIIKGRNYRRNINIGLTNITSKNNNSIIKKNILYNTNQNISKKLNNKDNNNYNKNSFTKFYLKFNNYYSIHLNSSSRRKNNKPLIRNYKLPNTYILNSIKDEKKIFKKKKELKIKKISSTNKSNINKNISKNKSRSKNKSKNFPIHKILSSSSSNSDNLINNQNDKNKLSIPKNPLKHKKIKSQNSINSIRQILCITSERISINPEIMKMIEAKIHKSKNLLINRKISKSNSSNKRTFFTSTSNTFSYNNKSNNYSKKNKNEIKNNNNQKNINVTHRNYRSPLSITNNFISHNQINNTNHTISKTNTNISKTDKLTIDINDITEINSSQKYEFDKIIKTYEHYPSKSIINESLHNLNISKKLKKNRRRIISNNVILPKQKKISVKGLQIKGFDELIRKKKNSNALSERIKSSHLISKSNRNSNITNKINIEKHHSIKKTINQ